MMSDITIETLLKLNSLNRIQDYLLDSMLNTLKSQLQIPIKIEKTSELVFNHHFYQEIEL